MGTVIGVIAGVVLFIGGLIGIGMSIDRASCHSRWEASGIKVSWSPLQGCNIQIDGKWIPEQNYREFGK